MLVFLLFLPSSTHYLSVQRGCRPFQATCLAVFTAASTSPSVPADCPHFQWRTGWFVAWSRRCHFTVVHVTAVSCPPPQHSNLVCDQLTIFTSRRYYLCWLVLVRLCSVPYASLLFPAFIPLSMASQRSSIQLSSVDLIFFLASLCHVGRPYCSLLRHMGVSPLQFSSLV